MPPTPPPPPPPLSLFFLCGGVLTAHIKDHKTKVFAQLSALQRSTLTPTKRRYNHCIGWLGRKRREQAKRKRGLEGGLNYKLFAVLETQSAAQILSFFSGLCFHHFCDSSLSSCVCLCVCESVFVPNKRQKQKKEEMEGERGGRNS